MSLKDNCAACGKNLSLGDSFCGYCGASTLKEASYGMSDAPNETPIDIESHPFGYAPPSIDEQKPRIVIAGMVVVLLLLIVFIFIEFRPKHDTSLPLSDNANLSAPSTVSPAPTPTNVPDDRSPQAAAETQPTVPAASDSDIKEAVEGWAQAFRKQDTVALAGYYAPVVEQYFRKRNIERTQVQQNFESGFSRITSINRYEIADISVNFLDGASRATATFNKQWDTSQTDGTTFSGEEIERLTFERTDEGWKIVREEELNIIRVTKQ